MNQLSKFGGENMFKRAFNSRFVGLAVSLAIMFIFILTMATMSVLAGNASTTLQAVITSVYNFRELIGLGIAAGIVSSLMGGK